MYKLTSLVLGTGATTQATGGGSTGEGEGEGLQGLQKRGGGGRTDRQMKSK